MRQGLRYIGFLWWIAAGSIAAGQEAVDDFIMVSALTDSLDILSTDTEASSTAGLSRAEVEEIVAEQLAKQAEKKSSSRPTVTVFGRTHLETLLFPDASPGIGYFENPLTGIDPENRIQFRRIRIGVQGDIPQTGTYRVELDFGNPSIPTFRDTYWGFTDLPLLQTTLIGNQKRPLGLDAWNSNSHVIFMERPLPVLAFNPNFRRIGVQTYGHTDNDSFNWQVGLFELADIQQTGRYLGDSLQWSFNSRVSGTPWYDECSGGRGYLHLGLSNMYAGTDPDGGPPASNVNEARFRARPELRTTNRWVDTGIISNTTGFDTMGCECALNLGPWQFVGEYLDTWVDRRGDSSLFFHGAYVQASYFLTGEHEPWDRQTGRLDRVKPFEDFFLVNRLLGGVGGGWGAWQIAARWSYVDLTDRAIHGGLEHNTACALNWYWTPYSKVLFNVVYGQIDQHAPIGGYTSGHFVGMGLRFMMDY